jgi:hypothetical protein
MSWRANITAADIPSFPLSLMWHAVRSTVVGEQTFFAQVYALLRRSHLSLALASSADTRGRARWDARALFCSRHCGLCCNDHTTREWREKPTILSVGIWNEKCVERLEVFMAVTMKNGVFWVVTPCGSCKNWRFGGTWHLLHQGDKNRWTRNNTSCN